MIRAIGYLVLIVIDINGRLLIFIVHMAKMNDGQTWKNRKIEKSKKRSHQNALACLRQISIFNFQFSNFSMYTYAYVGDRRSLTRHFIYTYEWYNTAAFIYP